MKIFEAEGYQFTEDDFEEAAQWINHDFTEAEKRWILELKSGERITIAGIEVVNITDEENATEEEITALAVKASAQKLKSNCRQISYYKN
jgi:hypothetical protein